MNILGQVTVHYLLMWIAFQVYVHLALSTSTCQAGQAKLSVLQILQDSIIELIIGLFLVHVFLLALQEALILNHFLD